MSNLIVNIRFWYWHLQIGREFKTIDFDKTNTFIKKD
jgi:hypothetical protein